MTAEEAAELERARERMFARHKLIEDMIRNNEMQLKNESARGGAEIELECARRDVAREMPEPERKQNWKARLRVCRRSRRSISVSSPSANGSMRHCWNLKAVLRPMNTNVRGIRDEQDRDQSCGKCCASWTGTSAPSAIGIERGRRSKDAFFVQIAEIAEAMIARHGKDFAIGAFLLSAKFIAEGKPLINRNSGGGEMVRPSNRSELEL